MHLCGRIAPPVLSFVLIALGVAAASEPPAKPWLVKGKFSYTLADGTSKTQTLGAKILYEGNYTPRRYFLDGLVLYGKTDGVKSVDREEINGRFEQDLSGRLFGFAEGHYLRNPLIGFDGRYSGGPGLGYDFIRSETQSLSALGSVLYVHENETGEGNTDEYASWKVAADYRLKMASSLNFKQHLDFSQPFNDGTEGSPYSWYAPECGACGRDLRAEAHELHGWRKFLCRIVLPLAYRKGKAGGPRA